MAEVLTIIGKIIFYGIPIGFVIGFLGAWKYDYSDHKLVRVGVGLFTGIVIVFLIFFVSIALTASFGSDPV